MQPINHSNFLFAPLLRSVQDTQQILLKFAEPFIVIAILAVALTTIAGHNIISNLHHVNYAKSEILQPLKAG